MSFGNRFTRNVIVFGFNNSSSSHSDNLKNNFSILSESLTYSINGSLGSPRKKYSINFTKENTQFCLSLHYNDDNSYLFVNVIFSTPFCLRSISNEFSANESKEVSFNGNVYDFSVDYSSIDKSNILSIHKYLMAKNNIQ